MRGLPLLLVCCLSLPARALVVEYARAPEAEATNSDLPGWRYVGVRGGLSAIYLGDGWVLTAHHVGAGPLRLDGRRYPPVPQSAVRVPSPDGGTPPDLLLFRIDPHPDLPRLAIRRTPPPAATPLVMVGCGRGRGERISFGELPGWRWALAKAKRWGTNEVARTEVYDRSPGSRTRMIVSDFTPGRTERESQAAYADSGGAFFTLENGRLELAGVMISIWSHPGQPSQTAVQGNLTLAADLSHYRELIRAVTDPPDPSP